MAIEALDDRDWPLGPDAVAWRCIGDLRGLLGAGRSLLLQVAHPVVGAGVLEFSRFQTDPWGRLWATMESLMVQVYGGGERAAAESRRLRELHRTIRGVDDRGRSYQALSPEAYAWVWLSIFDTAVVVQRLYAVPLTEAEEARLYAEWRTLGRVVGLRPGDMPATTAGLRAYVEEMVRDRLEDNRSVRDLLASLSGHSIPTPHRLLPSPLWAAVRPWLGQVQTRATVGTLPPPLRERLGLAWTPADRRALDRVAALTRRVFPLLPLSLRFHPTAAHAIRQARRAS